MLNNCPDYSDEFFGKSVFQHWHQRLTLFIICTDTAPSTIVTWCKVVLQFSPLLLECIHFLSHLLKVPPITWLVILSSSNFPGNMIQFTDYQNIVFFLLTTLCVSDNRVAYILCDFGKSFGLLFQFSHPLSGGYKPYLLFLVVVNR